MSNFVSRAWANLIPGFQLSLRAAVAAGLALIAAQLLRLQHPLYAMISAVIVTDLVAAETAGEGQNKQTDGIAMPPDRYHRSSDTEKKSRSQINGNGKRHSSDYQGI